MVTKGTAKTGSKASAESGSAKAKETKGIVVILVVVVAAVVVVIIIVVVVMCGKTKIVRTHRL